MLCLNFKKGDGIFIERAPGTGTMSRMHYHNSYEIYYVVKGEREYFIEDAFFKVSDGDLVFIPKTILHRTAGRGATRYLIDFTEKSLADHFSYELLSFLLPDERPFVFHPTDLEKPHFDKLFETMLSVQETESDPYFRQLLLSSYLYQILFTMRTEKNTYIQRGAPDRLIESILKYINENFHRIEHIEQIANEFYISKYHLCHLFQKNLGAPVVGYLNAMRVKHACTLLKESTDILNVAFACGFNSSSYFSKVFKKEMGISPSEYRILQKGGKHYEKR